MTTQGSTYDILLVEDNPADRLITTEALTKHDLHTKLHVVDDGSEALAYLRREGKYHNAATPDLIILDLNMPRLGGRQVLVEVKADPILKFIPVIVLSSSASDDDVLFAYGHHANGYITMPMDFNQMENIIGTLKSFLFNTMELPSLDRRLKSPVTTNDEMTSHVDGVIRVLLLESYEEDIRIVERMLEEADTTTFTLKVCGSVADAENMMSTEKFDVLLADLALPDSRGIQALKRLKLSSGRMPVIILTSSAVQGEGIAAIKHGAADYVLKDGLKSGSLVQSIQHALDHDRILGQLGKSSQLEILGQLSAGIAHEFNNLLTVIQGYSSLLLENVSTDDVRIPAELIDKAATKAAKLSRQLLSVTRKKSLIFEYKEINSLVEDFRSSMPNLSKHGIGVNIRLSQNDIVSRIDAMLFEQILTNLVINARDAMPAGGELFITTNRVEISELEAETLPGAYVGSFAMLEVSDTGTGIRPEILKKIFDPFFTTKELTKGSGLGLATVSHLVQQHKGWINVASQLGRGTRFRIFFPLHKTTNISTILNISDIESVSPVKGGNETILIVDDKATLREMTKRILERNDFKVLEAGSGSEALEVWKCHRESIDLLFTDFSMPGTMTGLDLVNEIKRLEPTLPVIMASGFIGDHNEINRDYVFLPKPFNSRMLLKTISNSLNNTDKFPIRETLSGLHPSLD